MTESNFHPSNFPYRVMPCSQPMNRLKIQSLMDASAGVSGTTGPCGENHRVQHRSNKLETDTTRDVIKPRMSCNHVTCCVIIPLILETLNVEAAQHPSGHDNSFSCAMA